MDIRKKQFLPVFLCKALIRSQMLCKASLAFFFQSAHAPYKVIDALAHLGLSISTDAINMAIRSLSTESENALRKLGQSSLASYAYNNFDVDLKSQVPTAEKSNDSLKHLTSGLLFPLVHGITSDNLKCSEELWKMLQLNPHIEGQNIPQRCSMQDLINLHPDALNASSLSHCNQFNAWMYLHDLCSYGPDFFHQFKSMLQEPEPVEQIPLVKTPIYAA